MPYRLVHPRDASLRDKGIHADRRLVLKLSYAERSGAGAYEHRRFTDARRAWRKRVLPRVRLLTLPLAALGAAYLIFGPATKAQWFAGSAAGALVCMYLWARDEVPEHIRRHGEGAEGERATADALAPLRKEGWHLAHNIDTGHGNRDHVAVGPGGVFLLDSKQLGGTVTVAGDAVRVERVDDPRDSYELRPLAPTLRREARRLYDEITDATGQRIWVTPVVVFWSRFDARHAESDGVVWVHGKELAGWLRKQPARLGERRIARIAEHLG